MKAINIVMTPRDGLFCKDGRGWFTSTSGRGHGLEWPYPSTVLGALRSIWGRAREQREAVQFVGLEWQRRTADVILHSALPIRRCWGETWSSDHRVWPAPADAQLVEGGQLMSLEPKPSPVQTLGIDDDDAREQLWTAPSPRGKPMRGPLWWGEKQFIDWLCGARQTPPTGGLDLQRRIQTHVGISSTTGAALDQQLYSHDVVETLEPDGQWGLACRVTAEDAEFINIATLGSDRRLAAVETSTSALGDMPKALLAAFTQGSKGLRLYTVSPAAFRCGWLPDGLSGVKGQYQGVLPGLDVEVVLRAAFVNRPWAISGWDMAKREPKPATRAVPPGAVYAFERLDNQPFTADHAKALWLAGVGQRTNEGFGLVVPGTWNPGTRQRS